MSLVGQSLLSHDGLKSCDVRCWSDSCQKIAGPRMQRSAKTGSGERHSIDSSARSTWREPGGAKGHGIGFNLRHITATELGLEPCGNREIRASHQKLFCGSSGLLWLVRLLIDDHDIGKAKSGISGMIRLKGRNRLFGSPR